MSEQQFLERLQEKNKAENKIDNKEEHKAQLFDMKHLVLQDMDLSGMDLSNIDFSWTDFIRIQLIGTNLTNSDISNTRFQDCSLEGAILMCTDMGGANLRYCNLTGANIEGSNLKFANLEYAKLDNIIYNDETKYFKMRCPQEGAFVAYKKCCDDRIVQLLIPKDAKRTSATWTACRCNKAKVLSIKSFDFTQSFTEADSLAAEGFTYHVGEVLEIKNFNEDRWMDSTVGIHFFMNRDEAIGY